MKTRDLQFNDKDLTVAGELIRQGELVAFPTETVYGLGANALDVNAVKNSYSAKGRPSDNPLLPKRNVIDDCITAGLDTVAIRMPLSVQAREFLRYANVPVTAPSANLSGRPSPTVWQRVAEDLDGRIAAVLCGQPCGVGIESTVLDLSRDEPLILRPGIVTPQDIQAVLHKKVTVVTDPKAIVNSPGVRYKHYAPRVPMALDVSGDADKLANYYDEITCKGYNPVLLVEHPEAFGGRNVRLIGRTDEEVARSLFENLRVLETQFDYIIASFSSKTQFAESILNRLTRSAGQNII